jgi:hypothetical protein
VLREAAMALGGVGVGVVELTMKGRAYRREGLGSIFWGLPCSSFSEVKKNLSFWWIGAGLGFHTSIRCIVNMRIIHQKADRYILVTRGTPLHI